MSSEIHARQQLAIGKKEQTKLENSTVCIVGVGGTGCAVAGLLGRAGVDLILIDRDIVEKSNLGRQILYTEKDIGTLKAIAAKKNILAANSDAKITTITDELKAENAERFLNTDLIIDCTDNIAARFLINEVSLKKKIPWIYTGAIKNEGMVAIFSGAGKPCFRCMVPRVPKAGSLEICSTAGVLGPLPSVVGSIAARSAIKTLLGHSENGKLLKIDDTFEMLNIKGREWCDTCKKEFPILTGRENLEKAMQFCGAIVLKSDVPFSEARKRMKKNSKIISSSGTAIVAEHKNSKVILLKSGKIIFRNVRTKKEANIIYSKLIGN
ncbi:TPA: HesA/MoeB/ThiF family protein [archaeon]|nr:HesA/MoeB/ThiF family protein [Candidatus Undinarchaeales archaeon SRR5007147.bin71]